MKYIKTFIAQQLAIITLLLFMVQPVGALAPATVFAAPQDANASKALCAGSGGTWNAGNSTCSKAGEKSFPQALGQVTNMLLFVIGAISVIVIIVGAIRYVTSGGEQAAVTGAKNTILYAVIGLIVAFMAYAIVNFVTGSFK